MTTQEKDKGILEPPTVPREGRSIQNYRIMHRQFITKPNPFITEQQAKDAYFKYVTFNVFSASGMGMAMLSLFRIMPSITLSKRYMPFVFLQMATGFGFLAAYARDLDRIRLELPVEEFNNAKIRDKQQNK